MNKNKLLVLLSIILLMTACNNKEPEPEFSIIPQPTEILMGVGAFVLNEHTNLILEANDRDASRIAFGFHWSLNNAFGHELPIESMDNSKGRNEIIFKLDPALEEKTGEEGYILDVNPDRVLISAYKPAGLFYAVMTLNQMLPPGIFSMEYSPDAEWSIPSVIITDKPRYDWRGMHLDVSRHFFPVEFIKRYIDLIALHKMNKFHWHLTDDNGWRMQIQMYPELTDISAWRVDRADWSDNAPPRPEEEPTYGGYYTQEEIEDVIKYAQNRFVEIIPEIEMPGHTSEVFTAFPELSCRGEKLYVQPGSYWPNEDIFCAGNEETFRFLENVLIEVAAIFPSEYIHIGGDEANKTRWKACPKCQQRIRDEGLTDEEELQSYFIKRIESFLKTQDKKLIGWDEILEGGLAPDATVMSWRGFEGGIEAAKAGHDVVMCPVSHCYFDYYQADPEFQPKAIGGLTTLKEVYHFNPTPPGLSNDEAKHILGAQGNLWTEYVTTTDHAEYMVLPRMTALAEVLWSDQASKNWHDFQRRLQDHFVRLEMMDYNYCDGSFKVAILPSYNIEKEQYVVKMESEIYEPDIRYTLDGSEPVASSEAYTNPIILKDETTVKAAVFADGKLKEKPAECRIMFHKGIGGTSSYADAPNFRYPGSGDHPLIDGVNGSMDHTDGCWQGFQGDNLDLLIDLRKKKSINKLIVHTMQKQRSWIFLPKQVSIEISDDGATFSEVAVQHFDVVQDKEIKAVPIRFEFEDPLTARYVRIHAVNVGDMPEWHWGHGGQAWLFVDEIEIR